MLCAIAISLSSKLKSSSGTPWQNRSGCRKNFVPIQGRSFGNTTFEKTRQRTDEKFARFSLAALFLWQGGFTFYAGVVVPVALGLASQLEEADENMPKQLLVLHDYRDSRWDGRYSTSASSGTSSRLVSQSAT